MDALLSFIILLWHNHCVICRYKWLLALDDNIEPGDELDDWEGTLVPRAVHPDFPLAVVAASPEACSAWLSAERGDAVAGLDDLCAAPAAWEPVDELLRGILDSDDEQEEQKNERGAMGEAAMESAAAGEFRPIVLADSVTRVVRTHLLRAGRLPSAEGREAFIKVNNANNDRACSYHSV